MEPVTITRMCVGTLQFALKKLYIFQESCISRIEIMPKFVLKIVPIFGILLCSYWIIYKKGLTTFRHIPNSVSPSSSVDLESCVAFQQGKNTVRHMNMIKLQPVPKDLKLFRLAMSESEMGVLLTILEVFTHTMDKYNLTYVMDGGSLLGTYRHHGPIPWDDDLDVMADIDQKETVKKALGSLSPEYVMIEWDRRLKLYSRDGSTQTFNDKAWRWPFLDIFWFKDTGIHIRAMFDGYKLKRRDFYPLKKRPFSYLSVYVPCNVPVLLKAGKINWNMCVSKSYNHKKEMWVSEGRISIPCKKLQQYHPFVRRVVYKDITVEYLEANKRTLCVFKQHKCY